MKQGAVRLFSVWRRSHWQPARGNAGLALHWIARYSFIAVKKFGDSCYPLGDFIFPVQKGMEQTTA